MTTDHDIYGVSEGWMLQMRSWVMVMAGAQIVLALALCAVGAMRRKPALLVMQPFFIASGASLLRPHYYVCKFELSDN